MAVAFSQSNLKLSPSCLSGLYPQGQDIALVNHVRNHLCNVYSMQRMRSPTLKEMNLIMNIDYVDQGIKDKLAVLISGIYARAEFISKHSSLWPEALSILMKSSTIDILVKDPLDTADALLCQCDLQFSDLEWYSFRALLSKILLSTEIMICSSPDMHERDVEDLKIYITNRFKSYYLSRNSLSKVGFVLLLP